MPDVTPPAPRPPEPSQRNAIWALCLTIFGGCCCYIPTVVGAVMAFKVLNRSEWERLDHGRGLAIGALGVAAFHLGSAVFTLALVFGMDLYSLGSGNYGAPASNADATIVSVSDLRARDCFDDPTLRGGDGPTRKASCTDLHDAEVIDVLDIPGTAFPGQRELREQARECWQSFAEYVGIPFKRSDLAMTWYHPRRTGWVDPSARVISCVVYDLEGQIATSVNGAER